MAGRNRATRAQKAMSDEQKKERKDGRVHHQGLGDQWAVLVGDPAAAMPQIVGSVIQAGGTRPCWQRTVGHTEYVLMAWPEDQPIRAAVLMRGPVDGAMKPAAAMPLLEGLPNDLMVEEVVPWASGVEAHVGTMVMEGGRPMWFYDPLYFRDKEDLTPGVVHTFLLAGLAFGVRKALLDEISVTRGPLYEAHAAAWLEARPDKTRLDVPVLKVPLAGRKIIMPGRGFCEYEVRSSILSVEKTRLDRVDVYMLAMRFTFEDRPPLDIMIYAPLHVCGDYEPQAGDEVDARIWLQGRVLDV